MKQIISIEGMGCDHCIATVRKALADIDGVSVEDVEIGRARVDVDPETASMDVIADAIRESGYEPASVAEAG